MKSALSRPLGLCLLASMALASPAAGQPKAAPARQTVPASAEALTNAVTKDTKAKPKVIDFEDETIRGTLTKPEGDFIDAARRTKQKSLIQIRRHFVPELLKSADEL